MPKTQARAKLQVSLRKSPKQDRSKDLVDAVMDAATRILESAGIDQVTTNKIAAKAGISIGSLYQYFPGKDAIFSMMIERQIDANADRYRRLVDECRSKTSREFIEALVGDAVDFFYERRVFIATLFAEATKLKKTREILYRRNTLHKVFIAFMKERPEDLRSRENIELQIYVVAHSAIGVLQTAVLEDFETQPPEALKVELTRLVSSYLLKS